MAAVAFFPMLSRCFSSTTSGVIKLLWWTSISNSARTSLEVGPEGEGALSPCEAFGGLTREWRDQREVADHDGGRNAVWLTQGQTDHHASGMRVAHECGGVDAQRIHQPCDECYAV